MPRKRKSQTASTDTGGSTATAELDPQPTPSDDAPSDVAPAPDVSTTDSQSVESQPASEPASFVERLGDRPSRPVTPDPFVIALDNAAGVRLYESRQEGVMAIGFEEKPSQVVIDRVKDEGYRWNPTDRVWKHAIPRDAAMSTRIDAERLYQEVRQMIREDKGIEAGPDIPF